jgi:hypothetical protein
MPGGDEERGINQRDNQQRGVSHRDVKIDAGFGPRVVVAVVLESVRRRLVLPFSDN